MLNAGRIVFQGPPSKLVLAAIGRVFQSSITDAELDAYEEKYDLVSTNLSGDKIIVRGIADKNGLPKNAELVTEPTLEESYLAFMTSDVQKGNHPREKRI